MPTLDHDALRAIASLGLDVALRVALVCVDWRHAIDDAEGGTFDTRRVLVALGDTALQSDLVTTLALTPITVKLYPHQTKRRHGGGHYNIFLHATAVRIFHAHGGASKLEARLSKRAARRA